MYFRAIIHRRVESLEQSSQGDILDPIIKILQSFGGSVAQLNQIAVEFIHQVKESFQQALDVIQKEFHDISVIVDTFEKDDEDGKKTKDKFKSYMRRLPQRHEHVCEEENCIEHCIEHCTNPEHNHEATSQKILVPHNNEIHKAPKTLPPYFTANEIAQIYQFPEVKSPGLPIAVISLGGSLLKSDMITYWSKTLQIPAAQMPSFRIVSVDGAHYKWGDDEGSDGENTLDVSICGGISPGSQITMYSAPNTDAGFYDAINQAIKDQNKIISISWGSSENNWDSKTLQAYNSLFQLATQQYKINIFAASGDNGSSDGVEDGKQHADFPASSPWVIASGGTSLICPKRNYTDSTTKETAWSWDPQQQWGGGGAISNFFNAPSFQTSIVPFGLSTPLTKRGVPDVSLNADPSTGWLILVGGASQVIGGTSAVAPCLAGLASRIHASTWLLPLFYQSNPSKIFHDIVLGNNLQYKAGPHYDLATGLGSINGTLFQSLNSGPIH